MEYKNGKTVGGYRNVYGARSNGLPVVCKNYSIAPDGSEALELDVTVHDDYSYKVIKSETNTHDGTVYTTISIEGNQCTYWFNDGMMILDFGMAYDAPGYFFKKLK